MTTIYVHNGDIGTIFRLTITDTSGTAIDVSTATTKVLTPFEITHLSNPKFRAFLGITHQ